MWCEVRRETGGDWRIESGEERGDWRREFRLEEVEVKMEAGEER